MIDPTRNKHGGNQASDMAWDRISADGRLTEMQQRIYELIEATGLVGKTSAEIERDLGTAKNKWSGRVTSLKVCGLVRGTGQFREGCEVLVATKHKKAPPPGRLFA